MTTPDIDSQEFAQSLAENIVARRIALAGIIQNLPDETRTGLIASCRRMIEKNEDSLHVQLSRLLLDAIGEPESIT